jgi:hypothetical protein
MVALIELVIGLFLVALVLLELTGKTDFLGRRKLEEFVERQEREGPYEREEQEDDDGPRF